MKSLISYILEREQKTYDFKVKIADVEPTDEVMDRIEHALKSFDVVSVSKPKHLPITDKSPDFPSHGYCDIYLILVSLRCPANDEQVKETIAHQGRLPLSCIVVIPAGSPEEQCRDEELNDSETEIMDKKPILTNPNLEAESGQELVGEKRLATLKDLVTRKYEFAGGKTEKAKTTNDLPMGEKDPLTSVKRKDWVKK